MCLNHCALPTTNTEIIDKRTFTGFLDQQELEDAEKSEVIDIPVKTQPSNVVPIATESFETTVQNLVAKLLEEEQKLPRGTSKNKRKQQREFQNKAGADLRRIFDIIETKGKDKNIILAELNKRGLLSDELQAQIEQIFLFPKQTKNKLN